jgi:hypothetical protein
MNVSFATLARAGSITSRGSYCRIRWPRQGRLLIDLVFGAPAIKLRPVTPVDDKCRSTQLPHVRKKLHGASLGGLEIDRHIGDRSDDHRTALIYLCDGIPIR